MRFLCGFRHDAQAIPAIPAITDSFALAVFRLEHASRKRACPWNVPVRGLNVDHPTVRRELVQRQIPGNLGSADRARSGHADPENDSGTMTLSHSPWSEGWS